MLTKGIIQSVDLLGNTCVVRIPLFETAGTNTNFTATAVLSTIPGVYNGYNTGDVVVVGFGSGGYGDAIVIGKLYLGVSNEKSVTGGTVHCSDFIASNSASLPANTTLNFSSVDSQASNSEVVSLSSYTSIKDLATAISNNTSSINTLKSQKPTFSTSDQLVGYWLNDQNIWQRTISLTEATKTIKLTTSMYWIDLSNSFIYNSTTNTTVPITDYEIQSVSNNTQLTITIKTPTLASTDTAYITLRYIK